MAAPLIESWVARSLADPGVMNRRVRDVHAYLLRRPAVRVIGKDWTAPQGSYTHLPCYPVGQQPTGIAFETEPGMAPTNSAGSVVGLLAPRDGTYRFTVGANVAPGGKAASSPDQPALLYLDVAVLAQPDFSTSAVTANAVTTGALPTWSAYSLGGTFSVDLALKAGQFVSVVARTPDLSGISWSDPRFHTASCFQELRQIGELP
ncbi:hypothetical protein [Streptomyces luteireticuli]|uniref:Uncharacterized protein n=1 Tax=Streptomyces luteireticuli TaxID=173858 RepID=A0ABP3ILK2_9ACTN